LSGGIPISYQNEISCFNGLCQLTRALSLIKNIS